MSREIYLAAKKLLSEECSVVPIARGKKAPSIKWEIYQRRLPTEREIYNWFIGTDNQLGLVTGNVSGGRFLLDFDGMICEEAFQEFKTRFPEFENGRTVVTGSGKPHVHGKCPDFPVDFTRKVKHYYDDENQQIGEVDLRGNRHQSLVPPSMHPCGNKYNYVDENDPVTEISRERFLEIVNWMDEGQKENESSNTEKENLEADELTPEQKSKVADYYLNRILLQVRVNHLLRNDKGYELARNFNNLKLPVEEAKLLMRKYSEEVPQWVEKEPYSEEEALASLRSAYNNPPESPWIPWSFLEEFEKEREIAELRESLSEIQPESEHKPEEILEPPDVFKGVIRKIAKLYSEKLESPYSYWVFNTAVFLGNIFSQRVKLNTSLSVEPRLYVSVIGASADERKSESGRQIKYLFRGWQDIYLGRDPIFRSDENSEDSEEKEDESADLVNTSNIGSAEGLITFLKKHPNTIYFLDELRNFTQKADIKGSNLLQIVNTLFEDTQYENITKGSHLKVDNAHLSFLACSTMDVWDSLFTSVFSDMGFINRLWVVPGKSTKRIAFPEIIPEVEKNLLCVEITKIYTNFTPDESGKRAVLEMDWHAQRKWEEWYNSIERNEFTKRLDTYGFRFMMIMCLSENVKVVSLDIVERVIQLLEWQEKVREKYYPASYETKEAALEGKILKKLALQENKQMESTALYDSIHGSRYGKGLYKRALKNLEGSDIVINKEKTGRRPKQIITLIRERN